MPEALLGGRMRFWMAGLCNLGSVGIRRLRDGAHAATCGDHKLSQRIAVCSSGGSGWTQIISCNEKTPGQAFPLLTYNLDGAPDKTLRP